MKLTIYFNGQFWCGLIEEGSGKEYYAFRHVFGSEPKDQEIETFVNQELNQLLNFSYRQQERFLAQPKKRQNPKQMQRKLAKEKKRPALSTKAQRALAEVRDTQKLLRRKKRSSIRASEKKQRFAEKQIKKRERKKGH